MNRSFDFDHAPFLVLWELTRACALACRHCRANAVRQRNPHELSTGECLRVLEHLRDFGRPLVVFTGGDPAERPDLFEILAEARRLEFPVAMTPSATGSINRAVILQLKEAGLARLAISLDGPDAGVHDDFRRVRGSFQWSLDILSWARECELPIQINTTVGRHNLCRFDDMAILAAELKAVLWSVFFLVPTGRATSDMQISPEQSEDVLRRMAHLARSAPYDVKATAAPHFRRVLIETFAQTGGDRSPELSALQPSLKLGGLRSYQSVNDGKGLMFISDTGDIMPSGFLPVTAGNVKTESPVEIYRHHPLFRSLRDPSLLKGKCGTCRYRAVCGGSRARAYAESGDYLASDSLCMYGGSGPAWQISQHSERRAGE